MRGPGAAPSPESSSPLISLDASSPSEPILPCHSRAGLDARLPSLTLPDDAAKGNNETVLHGQCKERKTSDAFVPPKPKEFDKAAWIGRLRAV